MVIRHGRASVYSMSTSGSTERGHAMPSTASGTAQSRFLDTLIFTTTSSTCCPPKRAWNLLMVYPSHRAAVSDSQLSTHPPNQGEGQRGLTSSWSCLAILPSIYLSHTGRITNKQQQRHVLSRHLGTPRPLPIVPAAGSPFPRRCVEYQYRVRALVACSSAWYGAGISGSILCGGRAGEGGTRCQGM